MPKVTVTLEKVATDDRAGEIAYQLRIANSGAAPIEIFEISPRVPDGAVLVEVRDSSEEASRARQKRLLEDLTILVAEHQFIFSEAYRAQQKELEVTMLRSIIAASTSAFSFWRVYLNLLSGSFAKTIQKNRERHRALAYEIFNVSDAERALATFYLSDKPGTTRTIFEAKLAQLKALTGASQDKTLVLADVEPSSEFSSTYVIQAKRNPINPRQFRFAIEVRYGVRDQLERYNSETSTNIVVSPSSPALLALAIVGSALGAALKFALAASSADPTVVFIKKLGTCLVTGPGVSSAILALSLFRVFERTEIAKKTGLGMNWRTALVVGVASGVFGDRVLAALKVFLGLGT